MARINGEAITEAEIEQGLASDLARLEGQAYALRRWRLNQVVADRLIAAEAARRGVTPAELLRAEVTSTVDVTEAEIDAAIAASPGAPPADPEVRSTVRAGLLRQAEGRAQERFLGALREASGVEVLLPLPPRYRLPVPVDGAVAERGPAGAPVTIVEFTDFQCPFCRAVQPTLREIERRYAGLVRLVHRDIPIDSLHPRARTAHVAARCAARQDRFWEFRERVFDAFPVPAAALSDIAADLGLDVASFEACRAEPAVQDAVARDVELAQSLGIESTPTFFINQRPLVGAQPLDVFVDFIEAELKDTRR